MSEAVWDPAVDPVLCSPYHRPDRHWSLDDTGRAERGQPPVMGRRPPIRISVPEDQKSGQQQTLHLDDRKLNQTVEKVRGEVDQWRDDGYPCVTATTRRLLHHWTDPQAMIHRLFFAQVEAAETLIWLREVATRQNPVRRELEAEARKHNDGIVRLCAKMATGTGKTAVMGMVIAWQTLNAARSTRTRNIMHTDRFVVFAPGHTVRERLGVLLPSDPNNVYDDMGIVPHDMRQDLNRAKVRVVNFQAFTQKDLINDGPARKLLGKGRGDDVESWEAAVGRVLGDLTAGAERSGVCVINDEAHHCYLPPERRRARADQDEDRRAAVWFNAIRALRGTGVLGRVDAGLGQAHPVLDFSATPLWIDTASKSEPEQFQWVASDFGLMDAIESGLVKVPRVPIDDDSTRDETVWRRLHQNTQPKKLPEWFAAPDNAGRLPEALGGAVAAVIEDWKRTLNVWQGDTERERERERERGTSPRLRSSSSWWTTSATPPRSTSTSPGRSRPTARHGRGRTRNCPMSTSTATGIARREPSSSTAR
ncbi:MAG: DEAD/DEAH box helicase family protein [bacterium]|nr:DEAD/DEAH box helicase family protein [bacterium]